jgi:hypothetical protein
MFTQASQAIPEARVQYELKEEGANIDIGIDA